MPYCDIVILHTEMQHVTHREAVCCTQIAPGNGICYIWKWSLLHLENLKCSCYTQLAGPCGLGLAWNELWPSCAVHNFPKCMLWTSKAEAIQLSRLSPWSPGFADCYDCPSVHVTRHCMEEKVWLATPVPSAWLFGWWYQMEDWPNPPFLHDCQHGMTRDPSVAWDLWQELGWHMRILQTCGFSPCMSRNTNTDKSEKQ